MDLIKIYDYRRIIEYYYFGINKKGKRRLLQIIMCTTRRKVYGNELFIHPI